MYTVKNNYIVIHLRAIQM